MWPSCNEHVCFFANLLKTNTTGWYLIQWRSTTAQRDHTSVRFHGSRAYEIIPPGTSQSKDSEVYPKQHSVFYLRDVFFWGSLEKFNILIQVHPTDQLYIYIWIGTSHRSYLGSGTANHPLSQHPPHHPGLLEQRASGWWSAGKLLKNTYRLEGGKPPRGQGLTKGITLQGINISYLGKLGKSSTQKCQALWDMLVPRRVFFT